MVLGTILVLSGGLGVAGAALYKRDCDNEKEIRNWLEPIIQNPQTVKKLGMTLLEELRDHYHTFGPFDLRHTKKAKAEYRLKINSILDAPKLIVY